jgi:hypothetical protein
MRKKSLEELRAMAYRMPKDQQAQIANCAAVFRTVLSQWGELGQLALALVEAELRTEVGADKIKKRKAKAANSISYF